MFFLRLLRQFHKGNGRGLIKFCFLNGPCLQVFFRDFDRTVDTAVYFPYIFRPRIVFRVEGGLAKGVARFKDRLNELLSRVLRVLDCLEAREGRDLSRRRPVLDSPRARSVRPNVSNRLPRQAVRVDANVHRAYAIRVRVRIVEVRRVDGHFSLLSHVGHPRLKGL